MTTLPHSGWCRSALTVKQCKTHLFNVIKSTVLNHLQSVRHGGGSVGECGRL